jgi:hypothetical protein
MSHDRTGDDGGADDFDYAPPPARRPGVPPGFAAGFLAGVLFTVLAYSLALWLPSDWGAAEPATGSEPTHGPGVPKDLGR